MIGFFFVFTACLFWALDTLIRYPLVQGQISAVSIVFIEHLLLTIIFSVVFARSVKRLVYIKKKDLFSFVIVGGIGSALATVAFTKAFSYLNPSLVILLQKFQPVVAIFLARLVLRERVQLPFAFWAMVCLFGALLIGYEDMMVVSNAENLNDLVYRNAGIGYSLVAFSVLGWGAATVFGKRLLEQGYKHEQVLAGRFFTGLLFLTPFMLTEPSILNYSIEIFGKISLMVFVSGLLAMYLYYNGLKKMSARACSLTELFFPFFAVIVNWIYLDATLSVYQIAGGLILILGSVVIQMKRL